jgi:hypothetical protein
LRRKCCSSSPEFILLFLPLAVTLHFALARRSVEAAILGTTISSFVLCLLESALGGAAARLDPGQLLIAQRMVACRSPARAALMVAGIVANLIVLGYFKYADFLRRSVDGTSRRHPDAACAFRSRPSCRSPSWSTCTNGAGPSIFGAMPCSLRSFRT